MKYDPTLVQEQAKVISRKMRDAVDEGELRRKILKERALLVIEVICSGDVVYDDMDKLKEDIYMVAHSAQTTHKCEHKDWAEKTEKMYKDFMKLGFI